MTEEKILAVDTEDNSKGRVFLINFFDGKIHTTFTKQLDAWNWLQTQGPARVWACNMEYDVINLFGDWLDKFLVLTFNSSAFIKAQWPGKKLKFLDTLRHWPMSVKSMGEFIGLPKLDPKGKGDDRFNDPVYCRRDTEIVWRFVAAMTERYAEIGATVESTLPSSAFKLFKKRYAPCALDRPSEEICDQLKGAAFGGRVEIFKTGLLKGPIVCYDVNSLYPYCMANFKYPVPATGAFVSNFDLESEGIARIDVEYPMTFIPGLPVRHKEKLVFPVGKFTGTWTMPEIRQAVEDGAKILKVHWFYRYRETMDIFKKYVTDIYDRRKKTKDEFLSYTLKLFMNSVYGKFTESGELSIFKNGKESKLTRRPDHSNIVLSAYTTAYGRLTLLKALRRYAPWLCYCDTDSIFLQDAPDVETGPNLGEWKKEGTFETAHFVLPKTYLAVEYDGKRKGKAKGIPRGSIVEFFKNYNAEFNAPIRYREGRKRMIQANTWIKKTRSLKAKYEKRSILIDGSTIPLTLGV